MKKIANVVLSVCGALTVLLAVGAASIEPPPSNGAAHTSEPVKLSDQGVEPEAEPTSDAAEAQTDSGSTMYESAILTAFGEKTRDTQKGSDAADLIAFTINAGGHLCAHPVEAQKTSAYQYGIGCITRKGSPHRSNYLLDIENGQVTPI